jgi:hypothetical protein
VGVAQAVAQPAVGQALRGVAWQGGPGRNVRAALNLGLKPGAKERKN